MGGESLLVLIAALCACGDREPRPPPAAAPPQPPRDEHVLWQTRVPATPGVTVLTRVYGPHIDGARVTVSSDAIGTAALELATGEVIAQSPELVPDPRAGFTADVLHRVVIDGAVVELHRDALARPGAWRAELPAAIDVGGSRPVLVGTRYAVAADERVHAFDAATGAHAWSTSDDDHRYAWIAHALHPDGDRLRALALDGGLSPAILDADGARVARGAPVPARRALTAAWTASGGVVVAAREHATERDEVIAFDAAGARVWVWRLPQADAPRADPIGLAVAPDRVVVFHDGRFAAALADPP